MWQWSLRPQWANDVLLPGDTTAVVILRLSLLLTVFVILSSTSLPYFPFHKGGHQERMDREKVPSIHNGVIVGHEEKHIISFVGKQSSRLPCSGKEARLRRWTPCVLSKWNLDFKRKVEKDEGVIARGSEREKSNEWLWLEYIIHYTHVYKCQHEPIILY